MKKVSKNNLIATVIKNYTNKKSGKVTDSRNEIQRCFFGIDRKDQKKIMAAFLDSGISDRNRAYSRLFDLWDGSFDPQVQALWETYHEEKSSLVIIRHFPKEYLKEHINQFHEGRNYYFICRRLVKDSDFLIEKDKLSKTVYLMALSHADRHIDNADATDTLYEIARDIAFHWNSSMELSRDYMPHLREVMTASDFANLSIALYYLEKMGNNDAMTAFRLWESKGQSDVSNSEEYKALNDMSISDYGYKDKLASIVQKRLYYALPEKYKTMTDEEYYKRAEAGDESTRMNMLETFAVQMSHVIASTDKTEDSFPL